MKWCNLRKLKRTILLTALFVVMLGMGVAQALEKGADSKNDPDYFLDFYNVYTDITGEKIDIDSFESLLASSNYLHGLAAKELLLDIYDLEKSGYLEKLRHLGIEHVVSDYLAGVTPGEAVLTAQLIAAETFMKQRIFGISKEELVMIAQPLDPSIINTVVGGPNDPVGDGETPAEPSFGGGGNSLGHILGCLGDYMNSGGSPTPQGGGDVDPAPNYDEIPGLTPQDDGLNGDTTGGEVTTGSCFGIDPLALGGFNGDPAEDNGSDPLHHDYENGVAVYADNGTNSYYNSSTGEWHKASMDVEATLNKHNGYLKIESLSFRFDPDVPLYTQTMLRQFGPKIRGYTIRPGNEVPAAVFEAFIKGEGGWDFSRRTQKRIEQTFEDYDWQYDWDNDGAWFDPDANLNPCSDGAIAALAMCLGGSGGTATYGQDCSSYRDGGGIWDYSPMNLVDDSMPVRCADGPLVRIMSDLEMLWDPPKESIQLGQDFMEGQMSLQGQTQNLLDKPKF